MTSCYCRQGKLPTGPALLGSHHRSPRISCLFLPSHPGHLTSLRGGERWGPCSLIMASRPEDHRLSQTLVSSHQLERKAKQTSAVKPLSLPKAKARVKPGQVCSLAGWGQVAPGTPATTLQEAELTVQEDRVCESLYPSHYSRATQICVGDPKKVKTGFKVSFPASKHTDLGGMGRAEAVSSSSAKSFDSLLLESNVLPFFFPELVRKHQSSHSFLITRVSRRKFHRNVDLSPAAKNSQSQAGAPGPGCDQASLGLGLPHSPWLRPPSPGCREDRARRPAQPLSLCPQGDSGGPLVCKKVAHGTFSYGKANGKPPGIFTQVSHFLPWIKRTMKQL